MESKTPALGDHQARELLAAPGGNSLKDKRDRAILSTLLYHALGRDELCKLKVRDFTQTRRGVPHLKVSGKGNKTRYLPLHPEPTRSSTSTSRLRDTAPMGTTPYFGRSKTIALERLRQR